MDGYRWVRNTDRRSAREAVERNPDLRIGDPKPGSWGVDLLVEAGLVGVYRLETIDINISDQMQHAPCRY